jgi:membrane protease YdiL (CAAX protease family)
MATRTPSPGSDYWRTARRPLQILVFLAPLIVAYEIGLAWLLRSGDNVLTNKAHGSLVTFFESMGVTSLGLGGIAIAMVLLIWHLLNRDPWKIDGPALGFMAIESLLLTLPLIAMVKLVNLAFSAAELNATAGAGLSGLDTLSKIAISVGAGLYEELAFRMMLIAIVHTLVVDLGKARDITGTVVAVLVSAAAFTWYHPLRDLDGSYASPRIAFYFLAGLYFGIVYVCRGFGVVVAAHAFYDVLVVTVLGD